MDDIGTGDDADDDDDDDDNADDDGDRFLFTALHPAQGTIDPFSPGVHTHPCGGICSHPCSRFQQPVFEVHAQTCAGFCPDPCSGSKTHTPARGSFNTPARASSDPCSGSKKCTLVQGSTLCFH